MKNRRCGECGSTELEKKNQKGKPYPWKDYSAAFLSKDYFVLECTRCNNTVESGTDIQMLSAALEESITEQVQSFIDSILVRENCKQSELAAHVGISPEHLSELKSGRKQPSFQTYNFLKTLAVEQRSFAVSNPNFDGFRRISA